MRMSSLYYYRQQQLIGHGRGGGLFALSSPLSLGRSTRFPPRSSPSSPSLSLSLLPVVPPPPPPSAPVVSVGRGPPDVVSRMHAVGRVGRGAVPPSYRRRRRGDSTYTYTVLVAWGGLSEQKLSVRVL